MTELDNNRLMVVDDQQAIARLFAVILADAFPGRTVDVAHNGREAVDKFLEARHSLFLMDLHMPVMDGQSAFMEIDRICRRNFWKMPVVVFCTGYAIPESLEKTIEDDPRHTIVAKPVRNEELVSILRERLA